MYLPQTIEKRDTNVCPPGRFCAPSMAIVDSDPFGSEKDGEPSGGPDDFEKPGPHRYIGVGMVAGMVFIVIVLYLVLGKRPRRFAKAHFPCCSHLEVAASEESKEVAMTEVEVESKPHDSLYRPKRPRRSKTPKPSQLRSIESSRTRVPQMRGYKVGVELEYVVDWEHQHTHEGHCDEASVLCNDIQRPEPPYTPQRQNRRSSPPYTK